VGFRTASHLSRMGAEVVLACRSLEKAEAAAAQIKEAEDGGNRLVHAIKLDLGDLDSVHDFCSVFLEKNKRLDVLVNNAGTNDKSGPVTKYGHGHCFAVNFLGPFLLTKLLLNVMKKTEGESRIVNLSSVTHHFAEGDFEASSKPEFHKDSYRNSKLAMLLFTLELNRRLQREGSQEGGGGHGGVTAVAVNPGAVNSDIWRHSRQGRTGLKGRLVSFLENVLYLTPDQGAATSVYGAVGKLDQEMASEGFYLAPYSIPSFLGQSKWRIPLEMVNSFAGPRHTRPTLPVSEEIKAAALWALADKLTSVVGLEKRQGEINKQ